LNDQSSDFRPATRARIVEAARQLFFQQGYHATGVAQILKAAEARSGSLYHFFPSKEDLLVAVLERYKEMLHPAVLQPAYARTSDPVERVFAVLEGYRRLLETTGFELGCPIGNVALENSNTHPAVRRLVTENFEAWSAAIAQSIAGVGNRLPPEIDPISLARHVLAVMEGGVMLARAYRSVEPFDNAVHQLRDYFERLMADGSSESATNVSHAQERRR
jgi:AcrR family transcriptional regulator